MTTERSSMSFREKSAWISFACFVIVGGIYFGNVARILAGRAHLHDPTFFFSLLMALIVSEIVLHALAAARSPGDARTPRDERELLIGLKATRTAFVVLLLGAIASIGTLHLGVGRWEMAQCILLAVVLAELAKFATEIVLYRRDA
jgi:hypothetical protein